MPHTHDNVTTLPTRNATPWAITCADPGCNCIAEVYARREDAEARGSGKTIEQFKRDRKRRIKDEESREAERTRDD